jgi:[protein-PII] uridylyltransferase
MEAKKFCLQNRMDLDSIDIICFLVKHHLLLSRIAQTQDLSDKRVIQDFCALVKTPEKLLYLYLLTVADIRATAPNLWNDWKAKLLEELYQQAMIFFNINELDLRAKKLLEIEKELSDIDPIRLSFFLRSLGEDYLLRYPTHTLVWHLRSILGQPKKVEPFSLCGVRLSDDSYHAELFVYTKDQPYLFVSMVAVLNRYGFFVHQALLHTSSNGQVLDHFYLTYSDHHAINQSDVLPLLSSLKKEMEEIVSKELIDHLPSIQLGRLSSRARHFPLMTQVRLVWDDQQKYPLLFITCHDRAGLLYALAKVMADLKVQVRMAKINTLGARAEDVFVLDSNIFKEQPQLTVRLEQAIHALNI